MRTEDKNNNFSSPQRQPAALISRYHMVPHSALCVCVCVQLFLILLSIFLLLTLALFCSSLSDMLPKVETRVVLVGEAGRNRELAKALQVHRFLSTLHFHCASIKVADLHDLSWSTSLFCVF